MSDTGRAEKTDASSAPSLKKHDKLINYQIGKCSSVLCNVENQTKGKGTFGKVMLGTHLLTKEKVAIKVLKKKKIVEKADQVRVDREIKILSKVRHPHVI